MSGNDNDKVDVDVVGGEVQGEAASNQKLLPDMMTQDVIEWNEGDDVDLRHLYPSPHPSGAKSKVSIPRTDSSQKSSNSSIFFGNDAKQPPHNRQQQQQEELNSVNLDGSFQQVSHPQRKADRPIPAKKHEQEIDGILGILDEEIHPPELRRTDDRDTNDDCSKEEDSVPLAELQTQPRHNKRQATGEIKRHRSHPQHNGDQSYTTASSGVVLRNRRRKVELMEQHKSNPVSPLRRSRSLPDQPYPDLGNEQPTKTPVPNDTIPSQLNPPGTTTSGKKDGFMELLNALTTPNIQQKKPPSRPPLGFVDDNVPQIPSAKTDILPESTGSCNTKSQSVADNPVSDEVTTGNDIDNMRQSQSTRVSISPDSSTSSPNDVERHPRHPEAMPSALHLKQTADTSSDVPNQSSCPLTTKPTESLGSQNAQIARATETKDQEDEDDEFDDVPLSANDLAMFDALAEASLVDSSKQSPPDAPMKCAHIEVGGKDHCNGTDESEDEYGDFPVEHVDFSKIDAMVATKNAHSESGLQRLSKERLESPNVSHSSPQGSNIHQPHRSQDAESLQREDNDDEFGDLPMDMDFGKIDALIASQTVNASASNQLSGASNTAPTRSTSTIPCRQDDDDEYEEFPTDIDFSHIDAIVEKQRREGTSDPSGRAVAKDPSPINGNLPSSCLGPSYPRFSRYRVLRVVQKDCKSNTQTISVCAVDGLMPSGLCDTNASTLPDESSEDGFLYLCGEWFFTPISSGDFIHVCSLTGRYRTDKSALPITLDTFPPPGGHENDLLLVLHPDKMMSPSIISEASSCNRRAVLKAKLGSIGLTSKPALVGTLVHGLFEKCVTSGRFDSEYAQYTVQKLLRENAEALIGCDALEDDVEKELLGVVPTIQDFASSYTTMIHDGGGDHVGGVGLHPDIFLKGRKVHSVEEGIVSIELGLRGHIDTVLEADISTVANAKTGSVASSSSIPERPEKSLICVELKTGHNQIAQQTHLAQLALYTLMLQSRYGTQVRSSERQSCANVASSAAPGGVLLYLNQKAKSIYHIAPEVREVKTLIDRRNVVVNGLKQACSPRGVSLAYDEGCRDTEPNEPKFEINEAPPAKFPDLKDGSHSCKRCFSNRECMLYAASGSASDTSEHSELMFQFTGHLRQVDLEYFRTWDRLIDIEADSTNTMARNLDPKRFKAPHAAVSGLAFDPQASFMELNGRNALVCFRRQANTNSMKSIEDDDIAPGSNVIVSTLSTGGETNKSRHQSHILKGIVDKFDSGRMSISCTASELALVKELVSRHRQSSTTELNFQIDKSARSVGTGTLRWNLINFLTGDVGISKGKEPSSTEVAKKNRLPWLRDVIIRLKTPEFDAGPPPPMFACTERHIPGCHLTDLSSEFALMNEAQQQAVRKCMSSRDYTLIQGLPGTGKSSTLTFLARLLVAQGRRVLISAYTHSAVDNIMLKLIESGMGCRDPLTGLSPLVRLGQNKSCHKDIGEILYTELAKGTETNVEGEQAASALSLKKVVSSARIVGVTALSSPRSSLLQNEEFDVVILDEAGQISQPAALGPLMAAKLFVLVGDHKQLPPLVNSEIAERGGYGISMLSRLAEEHPISIAPLTMQYRMNEDICKVSSEAFYGGKMKCGDDNVKYQRLSLPGFPANLVPPVSPYVLLWVHSVIDPQNPVVFLDTDQIRTSKERPAEHDEFEPLEGKLGGKTGGSTVNKAEQSLVFSIVGGLIKCGLDPSDVGVISPFRAQIRIMEESSLASEWKRDGLEMSTIDKYQGRDKSAIILSMVRSNRKGNTGRLLQDPRRLNVALTRAKCKLIIVGSFKTLSSGSAPLKPILSRMNRRNQRIILPEDANGR